MPAEWPALGTWPEKTAYIDSVAGIKTAEEDLLTVGTDVFPGTANTWPLGTTWSEVNNRLDVTTATLLEDMIVPGHIATRDSGGSDMVTLKNVRAWTVWTFEDQRVQIIEDCELILLPYSEVENGWGQGAINILAADFEVRRSRMEHAADGFQLSTAGIVEDCFIGNLAVAGVPPTGTHNDFVQAYGGTSVEFDRCWFYQVMQADEENHLNGLFSDGGSVTCTDCAVEVYKPLGQQNFTAHTGKANAVTMTFNNCLIRGSIVGDEFVLNDTEQV